MQVFDVQNGFFGRAGDPMAEGTSNPASGTGVDEHTGPTSGHPDECGHVTATRPGRESRDVNDWCLRHMSADAHGSRSCLGGGKSTLNGITEASARLMGAISPMDVALRELIDRPQKG